MFDSFLMDECVGEEARNMLGVANEEHIVELETLKKRNVSTLRWVRKKNLKLNWAKLKGEIVKLEVVKGIVVHDYISELNIELEMITSVEEDNNDKGVKSEVSL